MRSRSQVKAPVGRTGSLSKVNSIRSTSRIGTTAAARQPPLFTFTGKTNTGNVCGRNDMESYFEQLLACERVDGVDAFGAKGIQRLCNDLSIAPVSLEMYALVWKMGITRSGCIPRSDWLTAMYTYKIEQPMDLKVIINEWVTEARDSAFEEFYNDLYDYIRGDEARLMSYDVAVKAWGILFRDDSRIRPWNEWYSLVYQRDVTRDVWRQLGVFLSSVPTLKSYRVEDKWACAIDEYVEWRKSSS